MPRLGLSKWEQFKKKWSNCSSCSLCKTRRNVVLARGSIPCEILFIGEAPGASEDDIGQPFIGPAGKLLDQQIREAVERNPGIDLRFCFTNLVCCIPKVNGRKIGEPPKESIKACAERLEEFINLVSPRLIVSVGDLADKNSERVLVGTESYTTITHPAAILRAEIVRKDMMYFKVVVVLENAFREM